MKKYLLTVFCIISLISVKAQTWQTVFFDDFNRPDGALGSNYTTSPSGGITQLGILNNEVKVANETTAPAYWIVSYINGVNEDSIRISCKFRAPVLDYGFSISARDNGINTYRAGIMSDSDTLFIFSADYSGNSTKLAGAKANLDVSKTYFIEFTLQSADLTCRFVEVGTIDTITINATDNSLSGNKITLSAYYYYPNISLYFDDFKIESVSNSTGIDNPEKQYSSVFPNPASDFFKLNINENSIAPTTLNIYTIMGALVKSEALMQNQQQFNVSDLTSGIYLLEIKSENFIKKQTLMIER